MENNNKTKKDMGKVSLRLIFTKEGKNDAEYINHLPMDDEKKSCKGTVLKNKI